MSETTKTGGVWRAIGHGLITLAGFCFTHREELIEVAQMVAAAKGSKAKP